MAVNPLTRNRYDAPADVLAAVEAAITQGLPRPEGVYARTDLPDPSISLQFGLNDTADVDAWAALVGASVGFADGTYGRAEGAPWHEYGTAWEGSVYGRWLGRRVLLGCEVLGPHTLSERAGGVR